MRHLPGFGITPDPALVRARLRAVAGLAPEPAASARMPSRQAPAPVGPTATDDEVVTAASGPVPVPVSMSVPVPGLGAGATVRAVPSRAGQGLALLAIVAVVVAGWLTWRSQGGDVVPVVVQTGLPVPAPPSPGGAASPPVAGGPAGSAEPGAPVVVQVLGAVRRPGVVRLPPGSRVADAVAAAGGVRPGRSTGMLNLARVLVDGEQIVVGRRAAPVTPAPNPGTPGTGPDPGAVVDLNHADAAALDTLPGVGPVTAAAILAWRTAHGGFTSVEQLREVDGIGPKTYERLAPLVRVGPG